MFILQYDEKRTDMKATNFQCLFWNALKGLVALLLCNFPAYILYLVFLDKENSYNPDAASKPTAIFGTIFFVISLFVAASLGAAGKMTRSKKEPDEIERLKNEFRESNYELNYGRYFLRQFFGRFWSFFLAPALSQIVMYSNYSLVSSVDYTVFEAPVSHYRFHMSSIAFYEWLGEGWRLAPLLYLVLFISIVTLMVYVKQKKHLVKPSYAK